MIGHKFKAHKSNVEDLFERYKINKNEFEHHDGIDLDYLESRVQSLREGKFTLAVAGEVKSGKSTFINALLGIELLPSDVLQATSSIVEIFKSKMITLKVEYADGSIWPKDNTELSPDDIKVKLKDICQLDHKYRDIPTTLVDQILTIPDYKIEINELFISELEKSSNSCLKGKEEILKEYIFSRELKSIPIKIEIGYPFKWNFDELRIVDSPGVNAIGGVQNISYSYFEKANAILFIHPVKPVESESFRKFVNNVVTNRSKKSLFLILTHAGLFTTSDLKSLHGEARRIYSNTIIEEKIMLVDSLLQLIIHDLESGLSIEDIENISEEKGDILAKFEKRARKENRPLIDILKEASRFEQMYSTIDEFSMYAPKLQLIEIIESIRKGYYEQNIIYSNNIELLNMKKVSPQKFEDEIYRINKCLDEYVLLINNTKEDLLVEYTGKHTLVIKSIEDLEEKHHIKINNSSSFDEVRKIISDYQYEIEENLNNFICCLTTDLKNRLSLINRDFKENENVSMPVIHYNAIIEKTKKDSYKTTPIYERRVESVWDNWNWLFFRWSEESRSYRVKVGTRKVYSQEKHLKSFKSDLIEQLDNISLSLLQSSKNILENYLELFEKEIKIAIEDRKKALVDIREEKKMNSNIICDIEKFISKKKELVPEKKRLDELWEELK